MKTKMAAFLLILGMGCGAHAQLGLSNAVCYDKTDGLKLSKKEAKAQWDWVIKCAPFLTSIYSAQDVQNIEETDYVVLVEGDKAFLAPTDIKASCEILEDNYMTECKLTEDHLTPEDAPK